MPRHINFDAVRAGMLFADRYYVVRPIKAGGMGAVFEVQHIRTHRPHALKVMHPDVVKRKGAREKFEQEAYIGTRIGSQHVVEVSDAGVEERTGLPYLVMELLIGSELAALIEREGRLVPADTVDWLAQVAHALDKAHDRGIIHRDLKPENIFVTRPSPGTALVKVLDFGIAKIVEGASREGTDETGTPLYMAPEQTARGQMIGPHTDVWALGLVVFESLVGSSYWRARSVAEFYRELLFDELSSAEERARACDVQLPAGFDRWFFRCVDREPTRRFSRAGVALAELAEVFGLPAPTEKQFDERPGSAPRIPSLSGPARPHIAQSTWTDESDKLELGGLPSAARAASQQSAHVVAAISALDSGQAEEAVARFDGRRRMRALAATLTIVIVGGVATVVYMAKTAALSPTTTTSVSVPVAPTASVLSSTIEEALARARGAKLACYDRGRMRRPDLRGKVVIEFDLRDDGRVGNATVTESTLGDPSTETCLLDVVRGLRTRPLPAGSPRLLTDTTELGS